MTKLSSSGTVLGTFSVGRGPYGIAIDSSGSVWVTNAYSGTVTEITGAASGPQFFPYPGPQWPWGF
ncbi:MAG: hypothetical protein M1421_07200 [Candidatus Eremiobacteraeota bacterium]|nr:hypothetical protein [Candidatus Eremiobacteraeota bacterium]MCL5054652.1 hypothetical protein [Bacillota bacterium]